MISPFAKGAFFRFQPLVSRGYIFQTGFPTYFWNIPQTPRVLKVAWNFAPGVCWVELNFIKKNDRSKKWIFELEEDPQH